MKAAGAFLLCCRVEVPELEHTVSISGCQWQGKSEQKSELCTAVQDGVEIVPIALIIMAAT